MRRAAALLLLLATGGAQPPRGAGGTAAAIDAARRGGVVVACRHGITDAADENEATLRYDDPSTQRRLSGEGERQAESLGRAVRALGVPATG